MIFTDGRWMPRVCSTSIYERWQSPSANNNKTILAPPLARITGIPANDGEKGGVYSFDFGPQQGHFQEGKRFLVVVQTNVLNQLDGYPNVIVVPTTTKGKPSPSFAKIEPSGANGLTKTTFAICNQILTMDKGRLKDLRGKISKEDIFQVKEALKVALAIT